MDPVLGYRIRYPRTWVSNVASADVPACRGFSDVGPFDIPSEIPGYVRIWLIPQTPPPAPQPDTTVSESQVTVGGRAGIRRETVDPQSGDKFFFYAIDLGPEGTGYLIAATSSRQRGDFATNRRILDWMMQTLEFGA